MLQADLAVVGAEQRILDGTQGRLGRPDLPLNMASIYRPRPLDEIAADDWENQMAVDLRAAWLCARAAVSHTRRVRGGRIVNISDWLARSGRPRYTGYLTYYV